MATDDFFRPRLDGMVDLSASAGGAGSQDGSMPFRVERGSLMWLMPRRTGWPADA